MGERGKTGPGRSTWYPEPGFYRLRLVKKGPMVPCRIRHEPPRDPETGEFLDRSWYWHGDMAGQDDPDPSPEPTQRVWRIWLSNHKPIEEAEYNFLVAEIVWAKQYAPEEPNANPRSPVKLKTVPTF